MPSAASSTAASPDAGSPFPRTGVPGSVVVLRAVWTVQSGTAAAAPGATTVGVGRGAGVVARWPRSRASTVSVAIARGAHSASERAICSRR